MVTRTRISDVAQCAAEEFSRKNLHNPSTAEAIVLPFEESPGKVVLTKKDWDCESTAAKLRARNDALLASRTLCSAFYDKCGYVPTEYYANNPLDPVKGKGAAVFQSASRLESEANLSLQDLSQFLHMKAIKQVPTESILGAQAKNNAAHSMAVFLVSYYLTKNFRAFPDPVAESIIRAYPTRGIFILR